MTFRLVAYLSIASLVTAFRQVDYGTFIYEVKKPHPFKLTLTTTHDHYGLLSIQCGKKAFRDNWLKLTVPGGDIYDPTLNEFPDTEYGKMLHQRWVRLARETCPELQFYDSDLEYFFVNKVGDAATQIGGGEISVPRQWYPLIPGRYWSEPSTSSFRLKIDVHPDGTTYVVLGCKAGDTGGHEKFRLVKKDDDERYELTTFPGHPTVEELLDSFKQACPDLWNPRYAEQLKNVGFANYDAVYVWGYFGRDRLHRQPIR
ncbi:hypothetical protein FOZ60_000105 [Perkinsus olseni]|uniref:Uncharacterized protein n=1 Tax=Perkinsus olseni TaxID=32597 RepID=A0A7J6PQ97_PEROL|nr:hypothetical protein FOZ60_000105 [Perkinsus olseni]